LTALASLVAVGVGVGSGVISTIRPGGRLDQVMMLVAVLGVSVPDFLLGLLLILTFAISLRWFPVAGYASPDAGVGAFLRYMMLPAVALGITQAALIARITRASMVEVKQADYVRTARAKGLGQRTVLLRHVLRAALIPTITVVGLSCAILLGGAVVIETIFTIPGLGQLLINSVLRRDYLLIEGAVLVMAIVYIAMNVVVDLAYALVDPRIKYS
jgi:peptide/nickel transport system permease protein